MMPVGDFGSGTSNSTFNGPASGFFGALAASNGNPYAQATQTDAAVSDGMKQLSGLMQANGGDPAQAMLKFVQTPEGQRVMAIPGAYKTLTENFQKSVTNPPPVSVNAGPGTDLTQNGNPVNLQGRPGYTPPSPTSINTPAGTNTATYQTGPGGVKNTANLSQPTGESQHLEYVLSNFGQGLTQDGLAKLAQSTLASTPFAAKQLNLNQLLASKQITSQEYELAMSGRYTILQDPKIPGRFYVQNAFDPTDIHMMQLGGLGPNPTLNPSLTNGEGVQPETLSSTPPRQGQQQPQVPGQQGAVAPGPGSQLPAKTAQVSPQAKVQTAQKYNAPVESILADGTIDPVKAYGPGVLPILGAGLPAIIENKAGILSRWIDPSNPNATSLLRGQAEVASEQLSVLLGSLGGGNTRIKMLIENLLELGPAHEKMDDPQYATDQLQQLRSMLSGQARVNSEHIRQNLMEGIPGDNEDSIKYKDQNASIEKVLRFLPSDEALSSLKQAIQDGKVHVQSMAGAAGTVAKVTGEVVKAGAREVGLSSTSADQYNADVPGTVSKIESLKSPAELKQLGIVKMWPNLTPTIQNAISKKIESWRAGAGAAGGAPLPFAKQGPSQEREVKTPSGKRMILPPVNGIESEHYNGRSPFAGGTPQNRVNSVFKDIGM